MNASPRTRAAVLAAAALTATLFTGCAAGGDGADDPSPAAGSPDAPTSETTGAGEEPTTAPSPTPADGSETPDDGGTGETVTVPVYFVGGTPQGPRLFREFRRVEAAQPLDAATALMTSGDALDPDYLTLYPGGAFASVTHQAGGFSVQLADDAWRSRPARMSASEAKLAVQQLVHTVQGVAQSRDPVTVYLDGEPTSIFGIDSAAGLRNAPQLDVAALVNLTSPEEGDTVRGSFVASGVASSFEATVPWELRQGTTVVRSGFATAEGWMDKLYPFSTEVDVTGLAPGRYTFVAMTDDPSGGEGGGPTQDSKEILVR